MDKSIVSRCNINYQLISLTIDIVNKVLALEDCSPDVVKQNPHLVKVSELAKKWNECFIDYISAKERGK